MRKELHDWYAQHGICVVCGQDRAAPHRKLCWGCLDNRNERICKYRDNMTEEQKQAERKKLVKELKRNMQSEKPLGDARTAGKIRQNLERLCVRRA